MVQVSGARRSQYDVAKMSSVIWRMQPRKLQLHVKTQSNRVSDFRDFVCSLFPKTKSFFDFYFTLM